jgi:imidazolonepropionase-like amidohydrolase
MTSTLFRNVRIFDGDRTRPENSVLTEGGVITRIGHDLPAPPGAEIKDSHGACTLLPGLIDAHTHLMGDDPLRQALTFGVTTELSMGDDPEMIATARADQDTARGAVIADVRSAGVSAKAPGGHAATGRLGAVPTITRPEQAGEFVAARLEEGSDYLKIRYDDGQLLGRVAGRDLPFVSRETMAAVAGEARAAGKDAIVHIGTLAAARDALDVGATGLAHVFVDTPGHRIPEIAGLAEQAAECGAFVVPTLTIFTLLGAGRRPREGLQDGRFTPYLALEDLALAQQDSSPLPVMLDGAAEAVRRFDRAGVPVLCGTDANAFLHGVGMHLELELLVRAGLTASAALTAATAAPADRFGLADRGRIAPGQRADLLLVRGDPTSDIHATRAIEGIWKQGREVKRVPREELPGWPDGADSGHGAGASGGLPVAGPPVRTTAAGQARPGAPGRGSGFLVQSQDGEAGDFALVVPEDPAGPGGPHVLVRYRRDNDAWGYPWRRAEELPPAPGDSPIGAVTAAVTPDGGLEVAARAGDGGLARYCRPAGATGSTSWQGPLPLPGVPADPASGRPAGDPALAIRDDGADLLVPGPDRVRHYRRDGHDPATPWQLQAELPGTTGGVALAVTTEDGLELAAWRTDDSTPGDPAGLVWYELAAGEDRWDGPWPVPASVVPAAGQENQDGWSTPALVAGDDAADLVLPTGGTLAHLRRSGQGGTAEWTRRDDLPVADCAEGPAVPQRLVAAMMRGTFGNLELSAYDAGRAAGPVTPYYLDQDADAWSKLPPVADGQKVFGDLSVFTAALGKTGS